MLNNVSGIDTSVVQAVAQREAAPAPKVEVKNEASALDGRPPYVSPAIRLDYQTSQVVLEFRDSESGEVEKSIPSESQIEAYNRTQTVQSEPRVDIAVSDTTVEVSAVEVSAGPAAVEVNTTARTQSSTSLGADVPLGNGDTSSF